MLNAGFFMKNESASDCPSGGASNIKKSSKRCDKSEGREQPVTQVIIAQAIMFHFNSLAYVQIF